MTNSKFETRKDLFTLNDVISNGNYEGKLIVLNSEELKDEYKTPQNQIVKAIGGFGCDPTKIGTKVFGKFVNDLEDVSLRRNNFLGVLKNEVANEIGLCPCGNNLHEEEVMNALSRKDNTTYICRSCENKELQEKLDKLELESE